MATLLRPKALGERSPGMASVPTGNLKAFKLNHLVTIEPMTENQRSSINAYKGGDNLVMSGSAGTGKTFLAMHMAMELVLDKSTPYDKVIVVRSAVPTRDMGFMPGDKDEKEDLFTAPYRGIVADLFQSKDSEKSWNIAMNQGLIEFMTTSYIRGITLSDAIVVVDEFQNMTYHEMRSTITRLGDHTRIIFCGDTNQIDLTGREATSKAYDTFCSILSMMNKMTIVEFTNKDVVRGGMVRDFLRSEETVIEQNKNWK